MVILWTINWKPWDPGRPRRDNRVLTQVLTWSICIHPIWI